MTGEILSISETVRTICKMLKLVDIEIWGLSMFLRHTQPQIE